MPPRISLHSPIEAKIAWAEEQYQRAAELRRDPEVARLLPRLADARAASHTAMAATGMIEICRLCEEEEGGSCCGAGIEDRYDGVTLLINLLLGAELPRERRAAADCHFLGDRGCRLPARHVICVNFVCEQISEAIPVERMGALRLREGEELDVAFLLHARLTRLLEGEP